MPASNLVAVILAGGAGTRFWPLSTEKRPKQFLRLVDERSLLRMSLERIHGLVGPERILVLTNRDFVEAVSQELPEVPKENIVGEPRRRDTAAAVCLAALMCQRRFGDAVMAILTADHLISPVENFQRALFSAAQGARDTSALYTFGIPPTKPATGYGYLELGEMMLEEKDVKHFQILSFREKPDLETAREFLASGRFMWNSGMFVWSTGAILREMELHLPAHLEQLSRAVEELDSPGWHAALERAFDSIETISVDYGVMEKAREVRCAVGTFLWSDVGGWPAIMEFLPRDSQGNASRGRLFSQDSSGNLVFCEDPGEMVALLGVENIIVARAGRRTLVARMDEAESLKGLVQKFREELNFP